MVSWFERDDWTEEEVAAGTYLAFDLMMVGTSPREAFREACLRRTQSLPFIPRGHQVNILARRLGLCSGTHNLIARLSAEYGDFYTSFVRSIVETWAEQHRMMLVERPEMDMGYDPEWETGE